MSTLSVMNFAHKEQRVLVHLSSGIGNIVLATSFLVAIGELGYIIDLLITADYPQTKELFQEWSLIRKIYDKHPTKTLLNSYDCVIPAIPPFYWWRFVSSYRGRSNVVRRPPDSLFYQDEQAYYLAFATMLGYSHDQRPIYRLPIAAVNSYGVTERTLVIAPGCKTGEMGAKRWPYFPNLAESFEDVVIVGTEDDIKTRDGTVIHFPSHVRMLAGRLSLRETAELLASAGVAVGNDSGLSHIAAAVGTPTIMFFGPTPDRTLGQLPPNVMVMRTGLPCEPCWFNARFAACKGNVKCLTDLSVVAVVNAITEMHGFRK